MPDYCKAPMLNQAAGEPANDTPGEATESSAVTPGVSAGVMMALSAAALCF